MEQAEVRVRSRDVCARAAGTRAHSRDVRVGVGVPVRVGVDVDVPVRVRAELLRGQLTGGSALRRTCRLGGAQGSRDPGGSRKSMVWKHKRGDVGVAPRPFGSRIHTSSQGSGARPAAVGTAGALSGGLTEAIIQETGTGTSPAQRPGSERGPWRRGGGGGGLPCDCWARGVGQTGRCEHRSWQLQPHGPRPRMLRVCEPKAKPRPPALVLQEAMTSCLPQVPWRSPR